MRELPPEDVEAYNKRSQGEHQWQPNISKPGAF
jgi:hypothetical protein